ncbi:RimK/LysX family protein [Methanolobus sediminis]|uniref:RimK/LysX family protein n=1 Tax=Methanolobus sediminis TaxID=3072978 RepID=A0AA51UIE9_9EURY|nr:RimK/LysX family protein [Methanolobus sediminis]WMW24143.1 RimK/LysX family protein [Methanolobus sediminis]
MKKNEQLMTLGWREWVALPELGLPAIKAKVDTGARTSALHAFEIDRYTENSVDMVRFLLHPIQKNQDFVIECTAPLKDKRLVSDSGGHREMRFVIETLIVIGTYSYPIELTLTDRDTMRFKMLLGRTALENRAVVDPAASFKCGKKNAKLVYGLK